MSKIDELVRVFDDAAAQEHLRKLSNPDYKFDVRDMVRAGIRAVVTALRDESGKRGYLNWDDLNEILGSDAGEKVAGGSAREDEPGGVEQAVPALTPAADPAPDVCEWTATAFDPLGYAWLNSACGLVDFHERNIDNEDHPKCQKCRAFIKFTEAK